MIKILSDEEDSTFPVMEHLSIPLFKFIQFHQRNKNIKQSAFIGNIKNLMEQISDLQASFKSLSELLNDDVECLEDPYTDQAAQQDKLLDSINLIYFLLVDLREIYKYKLTE